MKEYKVGRNYLVFWRLFLFVALVLLGIIVVFVLGHDKLTVYLTLLVMVAVYIFLSVIYLPIFKKSVTIKLSSKALYYKKGIIITREYVLPVDNMIICQKIMLPGYKTLNICTLFFRGVGCNLILPQLNINDVNEILLCIGDLNGKN